MSSFYVYQYLREDNTPYYIGKGKGARAYASHFRQIKEGVTIDLKPKDVNKIEILKYFDLEEEALAYERELIATLPNLHNILEGGSQPPNHKGRSRSEATRKKMSESKKGERNPSKRPEVKAKISKTLTGRKNPEHSERMKGRPSPRKGCTLSEETKKKKSDVMKGKPWSEKRKQAQMLKKQTKHDNILNITDPEN